MHTIRTSKEITSKIKKNIKRFENKNNRKNKDLLTHRKERKK